MRENSLYGRKSLRAIHGPKAGFKGIAKDCVGFANAQDGVIDLGIEDDADLPDAAQYIPEDMPTKLINKIAGLTVNVSATTETITADNGGEFLRLFVPRNAHSLALTSDGRYYIRIGDSSKPVTGDDFFRLAGEKDPTKWENIVCQWGWQNCFIRCISWNMKARDMTRCMRFSFLSGNRCLASWKEMIMRYP